MDKMMALLAMFSWIPVLGVFLFPERVIPVWVYRRFATPLGREVARSVRDEDWGTGSGYYLRRADDKVEIWIANKAYGLRLSAKGAISRSQEFRPTWADRGLIWSEVRKLNVPTPEQHQLAAAYEALHS